MDHTGGFADRPTKARQAPRCNRDRDGSEIRALQVSSVRTRTWVAQQPTAARRASVARRAAAWWPRCRNTPRAARRVASRCGQPGSGAAQCGSADWLGMLVGLDSGSGMQCRRWVTSSSTTRLFSSKRSAGRAGHYDDRSSCFRSQIGQGRVMTARQEAQPFGLLADK